MSFFDKCASCNDHGVELTEHNGEMYCNDCIPMDAGTMKAALATEHGWTEADFEDLTFFDLEAEYLRLDNYDGAPCCPDPGCSGSPCTFPGYLFGRDAQRDVRTRSQPSAFTASAMT